MTTMSKVREEYRELEKLSKKISANEVKISGNGRLDDRYSDVLPYEGTRVKLQVSKFSENGYINGNEIVIGDNGFKCIATQGPLRSSIYGFWQLVWEKLEEDNNVVNVIMLTEVREGRVEKCFDYVDRIEDDINVVFRNFKDVNIERIGEVEYIGDDKSVEIREFKINFDDDGKFKIVRHFWVRSWPDFGIPINGKDCNIELIKFIDEKRLIEGGKIFNIVHCSAGVGRSGTFIGIDYLYHNREDYDKIFEIVLEMRKCRVMMVQRIEQYEYLYKIVKNYLK